MSLVHRTAIVEDGARLGADVTVGAFSVVGSDVTLRDGVSLDAHVMVRGRTTIGERTRVATFAVIGGEAQDLSYKGEESAVEIGADCIIREHVTIHRGTAKGRGTTSIGANCFLMIGSHVAHDCVLGDNVILTNQATIGGHSTIGDWAILGGLVGVQQRGRIGAHAFVGGMSGVTRDIVPFTIATGRVAQLAGINSIGLKRRGFDKTAIRALHNAYRIIFLSEGPRPERLAAAEKEFGEVAAVAQLIAFIRESGTRALAVPRQGSRYGSGEGGGEDNGDGLA